MTHPKRLPAAERLASQAPPGALRVVMDPDPAGTPSVLRTALAAWSAIEEGATHHLVVQDDMILSESFFARARRAVEEMPDAALALFALWDSRNGAAARFGAMAGARWVGAVGEYFPCVALILPRQIAAGFVAYGRRRVGDGWPDDILMSRYLRARGIPAYVSVPSFAEHEDHGSISGNAFRGPRRSVCFLPSYAPAHEGARLTGLRVVPFFKQGLAQCAVRQDGPGPERWLHLGCEQYLEGAGLRPERLSPARTLGAGVPDGGHAAWLTAFTMGFVSLRERHRCAGGAVDEAVLDESLATLGPGGISHAATEEQIEERRDAFARIVRAGLQAGLEAGAREGESAAGGAARPARLRRVGVRGAATPLGEHVVRGLTDRGHRVTVLGSGAPAEGGLDALLDLRGLNGPDGRGQPTIAVRILTGTPATPSTPSTPASYTLAVGDLYGPGCSRESPIGRLVWDALRSRPLHLYPAPGAPVRPLHTADLTEALSRLLHDPPPKRQFCLAAREPCTVAGLAAAVREAVRPVPLAAGEELSPARLGESAPEAARAWPAPPGWKPSTDLRLGLHSFAQWLAYEGIHLSPTSTWPCPGGL
ncbi:hypothetical protein LHJ74_17990 [Streptomyces sp. N2-109]|uniref:Uncharacterized protein n=1 Tax=Streptomyces gossypii TaxID=2883101 RepID=A0ABT2JV39_9ACTN|nr:hypothetical protein [Streptomyces gossypii]MCT2591764.1 hypothetical protein [Streptomyces gossypii]